MRSKTTLFSLLALTGLLACSKEKVCQSDQKLCGYTCTAVLTDAANCGACDHACDVGEVCSTGACVCPSPRTDCSATGAGSCVDLSNDPQNCGACGASCPGELLCGQNGSGQVGCVVSCPSGQFDCNHACASTATDFYNCGACGRACGTNEHCQGGLCLADLYLACFNTSEVREASLALEPAGVPLGTDSGPTRMTWLGNDLFVANTSSNTISEVRFDLPSVRSTSGASSIKLWSKGSWIDLEFIENHAGLLYVSNASAGTVVVVDPASGAVVDEIPLGRPAFPSDVPSPQGIAFVTQASAPTDKAYVALNGMNQVAVLDVSGVPGCQPPSPAAPACGTEGSCDIGKTCVNGKCQPPPCGHIIERIDVQPLASPNGQAQPARLLLRNSTLYVTLWNLDAFWQPAGSGRLAMIDTSNDTVGLIDLGDACKNPADLALLGDVLYVTCGAFDYSTSPPTILGNGILPIDLSGATPTVKALIPVGATEAPGRLAFCGGVGYAGDRNSGTVLRLDPASGQVNQRATLCPAANGYAYVADLTCGP